MFFILAGLKLDLHQLQAIGVIGAVYVVARADGLALGGWATGRLLKLQPDLRRRIGWCIMPQAGVAPGFALLVREQRPEYGHTVLTRVIATTILFEITGPLLLGFHLHRAGEWHAPAS